MYLTRGLKENLPDTMMVYGKQFCLFGDSGYAERVYLEVSFSSSNLSDNERAYN